MTKSQRLANILQAAKINATKVSVLGAYAHIDTFKKYEGALRDMMGLAGFRLHSIRDGAHMDGSEGFRMVFILP